LISPAAIRYRLSLQLRALQSAKRALACLFPEPVRQSAQTNCPATNFW